MNQSPSTDLSPVPRGFWSLMFTQFQGAFSDNALKWLVTFLVFQLGLSPDAEKALVAKAGLVFAVPFLLLSPFGGWMADRFSKRHVMIGVKAAEIGIMLFAAYALATQHLPLQLAAICLMGIHSALFAPAKYGILPEMLPANRLSWGNGILELLTFVAIIGGTVLGGWFAQTAGPGVAWPALALAALAGLGLWSSLRVPRVPAADPQARVPWLFPVVLFRQFSAMAQDRDLWRANWGNTLFFFIAALVQLNLALFAKNAFHLTASSQSWLQAALCLGIGCGSALAGHFSRGKIDYRFVPMGGVIMALAAGGLGWPEIGQSLFTVALGLLGLGAGLFIVPIAAVLQHRPSADQKGAVQGAASWLSWIGIAVASTLLDFLSAGDRFTGGQIFWCAGAVALLSALYVGISRPESLRR
jgi:acyl-[acyl-carrier-protein]-phospholipid O-acyltransferase / long-chain-fatty-acid--[acyl-carrier-protein] ligase